MLKRREKNLNNLIHLCRVVLYSSFLIVKQGRKSPVACELDVAVAVVIRLYPYKYVQVQLV